MDFDMIFDHKHVLLLMSTAFLMDRQNKHEFQQSRPNLWLRLNDSIKSVWLTLFFCLEIAK